MNELVSILKSLADDTRFKMLKMLLSHDLCVGALAHHLGISESAASQHLQILRKAGLVRGEKRGYWTHYTVERKALEGIGHRLMEITNQPPDTDKGCHEAASDGLKTTKKGGL